MSKNSWEMLYEEFILGNTTDLSPAVSWIIDVIHGYFSTILSTCQWQLYSKKNARRLSCFSKVSKISVVIIYSLSLYNYLFLNSSRRPDVLKFPKNPPQNLFESA